MAIIGLWSDCHNFPSLPLMKLAAHHKSIGDTVEHYIPLNHYDLVYASKVFSFTEDIDDKVIVMADEVIKGGTGYTETSGCDFCIRRKLSCTGLEGDCKENIRKWFESEVDEDD